MRVEEPLHAVVVRQRVQSIGPFIRAKQRACECLVWVGQGHQHEMAAGPNVQPVGFHLEVAVRTGQHGHFLVAVRQVPLLEVKPVVARHAAAYGAECPVGPKQAVHRHVQRRSLALQVKRHAAFATCVAEAFVVKFKPHVGHGLGAFHQDAVESGTRHRVDALPLHAVRLVGAGAVDGVHAAAGDGQRNFTHRIGNARQFQGFPPSVAQREVDASSRRQLEVAGVWPAFVYDHVVAAVAQHAGPQAADEAGTDHGHLSHGLQPLRPGPGPSRQANRPHLPPPRSSGSVRP